MRDLDRTGDIEARVTPLIRSNRYRSMAFVLALPVLTRSTQASLSSRRLTHRNVAKPATSRSTVVCHHEEPGVVGGRSIAETLIHDSMNKTLVTLATAAGIDLSTVSGTLFAPTEQAFSRLPAGAAEWLIARPEVLRSIILRHVMAPVVTTKQIKGVGYFEGAYFGPQLAYEALGPILKVGGVPVVTDSSNRECSNGIIHAIDGILLPPGVSLPTSFELPAPAPLVGDSTVAAAYPSVRNTKRAFGAVAPATSGGRKAMNLMKQLPFWMYGPPFNAAKQTDLEPISLAPSLSKEYSVDYQLLPAGSAVVAPDEVSAAKLNPVSGMSKYLGTGTRISGDGAQSPYADKLPAGY